MSASLQLPIDTPPKVFAPQAALERPARRRKPGELRQSLIRRARNHALPLHQPSLPLGWSPSPRQARGGITVASSANAFDQSSNGGARLLPKCNLGRGTMRSMVEGEIRGDLTRLDEIPIPAAFGE